MPKTRLCPPPPAPPLSAQTRSTRPAAGGTLPSDARPAAVRPGPPYDELVAGGAGARGGGGGGGRAPGGGPGRAGPARVARLAEGGSLPPPPPPAAVRPDALDQARGWGHAAVGR